MTQSTPSEAEVRVRAVIAAYGATGRSGDLDAYIALFHEDAIQGGPGRPPAVGRDAIRAGIAAVRQARGNAGNPTFQIEPEQIDVVGDIAVVVAHPQWGGEQPRDLTAMFVLRRDGERWLIWRQLVTPRS